MEWGVVIEGLAAFLKALSLAAPAIAMWLAHRAGKTAGRDEVIAEDNALAAKAREEYEKIEMEDRDDGPWLRQ